RGAGPVPRPGDTGVGRRASVISRGLEECAFLGAHRDRDDRFLEQRDRGIDPRDTGPANWPEHDAAFHRRLDPAGPPARRGRLTPGPHARTTPAKHPPPRSPPPRVTPARVFM